MLIKKMTMIVAVAFMSLNGAMVFASHNSNTSDDNSFSDVEATIGYQHKNRSFGDIIWNNKAITGLIGAAVCLTLAWGAYTWKSPDDASNSQNSPLNNQHGPLKNPNDVVEAIKKSPQERVAYAKKLLDEFVTNKVFLPEDKADFEKKLKEIEEAISKNSSEAATISEADVAERIVPFVTNLQEAAQWMQVFNNCITHLKNGKDIQGMPLEAQLRDRKAYAGLVFSMIDSLGTEKNLNSLRKNINEITAEIERGRNNINVHIHEKPGRTIDALEAAIAGDKLAAFLPADKATLQAEVQRLVERLKKVGERVGLVGLAATSFLSELHGVGGKDSPVYDPRLANENSYQSALMFPVSGEGHRSILSAKVLVPLQIAQARRLKDHKRKNGLPFGIEVERHGKYKELVGDKLEMLKSPPQSLKGLTKLINEIDKGIRKIDEIIKNEKAAQSANPQTGGSTSPETAAS